MHVDIVLFGLFLIVLGLLLTFVTSVVSSRRGIIRTPSRTALNQIGMILFTFGALGLIISGFLVGREFLFGNLNPEAALQASAVMICFLGMMLASQKAFTAATLAKRPDANMNARLDRSLGNFRQLAWATSGIGLLVSSAGVALSLTLVIIIVIGLWLMGFLVYRMMLRSGIRSHQASLLSLISIAVQRNLPLGEELRSLADMFPPRFAAKVVKLAGLLDNGVRLSTALDKVPNLVPLSAVTAIEVGEQTGRLDVALQQAIAQTHARTKPHEGGSPELSGGLVTLHLGALFLTVAVQVTFLSFYIVPKFKKIFEDFDTELPIITNLMIAATDYLADYFALFALPILALVVLLIVAIRQFRRRPWSDGSFLSGWIPRYGAPAILRSLASVVTARHPLETGLTRIAQMHPSRLMRNRTTRVVNTIQNGGDPWEALAVEHVIGPREQAILQSAERAGNLSWTLNQIADAIDRRFAHRRRRLIEMIQPTLVLSLGLVVMFVCTAMFVPIVHLINSLS